jgi:hypothetical protein
MVVVQVNMWYPQPEVAAARRSNECTRLRLVHSSSRDQQNLHMLTRHEGVVCRENERCRVGRNCESEKQKVIRS